MDFHYIRFSKRDGVNFDHTQTLRDADSLYHGLIKMGELALLDLWRAKRKGDDNPTYYRLWRGNDTPANALVYIDIIPYDKPEFRFRVDRNLLGKRYGREGEHIVIFNGFDTKYRYKRLIKSIQNRDYWHYNRVFKYDPFRYEQAMRSIDAYT